MTQPGVRFLCASGELLWRIHYNGRFQEVSLYCGGRWKNVGLLVCVLVLKSCGVRFKWCVSIHTFKHGHKGRSQIAKFVLPYLCFMFRTHFKMYDCIRFNHNIKLRPFFKSKDKTFLIKI